MPCGNNLVKFTLVFQIFLRSSKYFFRLILADRILDNIISKPIDVYFGIITGLTTPGLTIAICELSSLFLTKPSFSKIPFNFFQWIGVMRDMGQHVQQEP